jgi:hypothetical protein
MRCTPQFLPVDRPRPVSTRSRDQGADCRPVWRSSGRGRAPVTLARPIRAKPNAAGWLAVHLAEPSHDVRAPEFPTAPTGGARVARTLPAGPTGAPSRPGTASQA